MGAARRYLIPKKRKKQRQAHNTLASTHSQAEGMAIKHTTYIKCWESNKQACIVLRCCRSLISTTAATNLSTTMTITITMSIAALLHALHGMQNEGGMLGQCSKEGNWVGAAGANAYRDASAKQAWQA